MKDFQVGGAIGLLRATFPFLVFRFLIYFGITLAYILAAGVGSGAGYLVGHIGDNPGAGGVWGGFIGFGLMGAVVYWFREYLLYLVKAGHIAVLVERMDGNALPEGRGQVEHARAIVRERFVESSVLFGLDQLIKGILKAFNKVFFSAANIIPIPAVQGLVRFVGTVVRLSLTFLDEVILAYNIRTRSENPWESSRRALVLYAQNYKAFLKNAFFLTFFVWGLTFLVFLVALGPVAGLVALFPGTAGALTLVLALVFAWGIKAAVIEPFAMVALMQVFFRVTEGQEPNPEWEARLDNVSAQFGELKQRAGEWAGMGARNDAADAAPGARSGVS
ncbi:hypothetical protein [Aquisalimonas asiatica]|uniref:Etoposide-induced protein 2.4 (EI24) n=1 Tax=Aquisalimonas asiatica TaxID=406100 RepID=A0A1H8SSM2_9GAMM|nr:hypothetical protein [Aquisalimonas asiatica]SEO81565.1 hypothetical protein SAMN04488052_103169 [Aquisalimonas asiatica]